MQIAPSTVTPQVQGAVDGAVNGLRDAYYARKAEVASWTAYKVKRGQLVPVESEVEWNAIGRKCNVCPLRSQLRLTAQVPQSFMRCLNRHGYYWQ